MTSLVAASATVVVTNTAPGSSSTSNIVSEARQKEIFGFKTKEQIEKLTDAEIPDVCPEAVQYLDPSKFNLLKNTEQIDRVPEQHIALHLTADQRNLLSEARIKGLKLKEAIESLQPEQRKLLDGGSAERKVTAETLAAEEKLKKEGAEKLSSKEIQSLVRFEDISQLTKKQIRGQLLPSQIKLFYGDAVNLLSVRQIEENLPDIQVKYVNNRDMVTNLDKKIPHISPNMVQFVPDDKLKLLPLRDQIQRIPPEKMRDKNNFTVEQCKYFTKEQIENITDPNIFSAFTREYRAVIPFVPPNKVQYLQAQCYPFLETTEQVDKVPVQKYMGLGNKQWDRVAQDKAKEFTKEHVRWIPQGVIDFLSQGMPAQVLFELGEEDVKFLREILNPKALSHINPKAVPLLADTQFELLKSKDHALLLACVPPEKERFLLPEQMEFVSDPAFIKKLTRPELMRALKSEMRTHLTEIQQQLLNEPEKKAAKESSGSSASPTSDASAAGSEKPPEKPSAAEPAKPATEPSKPADPAKPAEPAASNPADPAAPKPDETKTQARTHNLDKMMDRRSLATISSTDVQHLTKEQVRLLSTKLLPHVTKAQVPYVRLLDVSSLGWRRFPEFSRSQKAFYVVQLLFKCAVVVSVIGLMAHKTSRERIGSSLKTTYGLLASFTKEWTAKAKDKFNSLRSN